MKREIPDSRNGFQVSNTSLFQSGRAALSTLDRYYDTCQTAHKEHLVFSRHKNLIAENGTIRQFLRLARIENYRLHIVPVSSTTRELPVEAQQRRRQPQLPALHHIVIAVNPRVANQCVLKFVKVHAPKEHKSTRPSWTENRRISHQIKSRARVSTAQIWGKTRREAIPS